MTSPHLIFVYGTLKRGFHNHERFLTMSTFKGAFRTDQPYPLVVMGSLPFLLAPMDGKGFRVAGEVFEVDDRTLTNLDRLEGHPEWYRRTPIKVSNDKYDRLAVEAYIRQPPFTLPANVRFYSSFDMNRNYHA